MNKIKILPAHEAQKIAAGEVIERPAHIIKELLENSLDAGATSIAVYLEEAGKKLIRIVDNGCGMSADDAALCFVKHATSKVSSLEDLHSLTSFGFRGEALASIAAVSKVTLKTRQAQHELGVVITYEQGEIIHQEALPCPQGADFVMRDLFYTMPVRKKFLRHDDTEINQVVQLLYAFALSNKEVSFSLYSDHKIIINAPACTSLNERIMQLWGYNTAQNLITITPEVHEKNGFIQLSGMISNAMMWRHARDRIFLFVNGRWIKDVELSKALVKGYGQSLIPGKFPFAFVFITIDPLHVDINVHPKKEEVRFLRPGIVEKTLQNSIQKTLESLVTQKLSIQQPQPEYDLSVSFVPPTMTNVVAPIPSIEFAMREFSYAPSLPIATSSYESVMIEEQVVAPSVLVQEKIVTPTEQPYRFIGTLFNTYLLLEKEAECVVIDQHAAHERVLYEQWKERFNNLEGIALLFPVIVTLAENQARLILHHAEIFNGVGIELEQSGKQAIMVITSPPKIGHLDLEQTIKQAACFIEEHDYLDAQELRKQLYEHVHSHMACKAAVRAGDVLTQSMIDQLIKDLLVVPNRFACIHGRPTMWIISKNEFEKKFRRC